MNTTVEDQAAAAWDAALNLPTLTADSSHDRLAAAWSDPAADRVVAAADAEAAAAWSDPEMDRVIDAADQEIQRRRLNGQFDFKSQSAAQVQLGFGYMSAEDRAVLADTIADVTDLMASDKSNDWPEEIAQLRQALDNPDLLPAAVEDVTSYMLDDMSNDWSQEVDRLRELVR